MNKNERIYKEAEKLEKQTGLRLILIPIIDFICSFFI